MASLASSAYWHRPDGATREEHDPLQFFVVKEVVEGPEAPLFTKRIRIKVWVVAEKQGEIKVTPSVRMVRLSVVNPQNADL